MTRPNLLLFMPDQLRADAVGAFGNPLVQTPNIDALAARGTRFANAYAQHSVCSQSRISMFTGWYPHVAGHRTLSHLLQPWEPNVFTTLREGGYHVALAGARGDMMGIGVTEASSDRFGFTRRPDPRGLLHAGPFAEDHKWFFAFYHGRQEAEPNDFDAATVATAIDWLTDGLPEPWCLFVPLLFPHPPFTAAEPWFSLHDRATVPSPVQTDRSRRPRFMQAIHDRYGLDRLDDDDWRELIATYWGMTSRVDDQLGRVLDAVDRAGVAERTVTFFFTDHGDYLGDYGLVEKWMAGLDDCLVRNPLIVHDPRAGSGVADSFAELVDLTPTLLELAEVEPTHTHFGRSLVPLLHNASLPHRDAAFSEGGFLVEEEPLLEAGAKGHYKHKQDLQHEDPSLTGRAISVRTERWAYTERLYEGPELFDRVDDPRETVNLAGSPDTVEVERELRDRVFRWLFETSDVIPWSADPRMEPALLRTFLDDEVVDRITRR
ncbi:MAG: sulfatase-like hydrolase/transferase [Actinomycetota bacterium]